ncbi:MAG: hypothetical protein Q7U47_14825 [Paludibacter sp.]|nr:hypothetical protein [Paludibacter sp.]
MKLNRKQIIKIIVVIIIGFVVYKCDIPLNTKPGTVTLDTKEDVFKTKRSLWVYKPVADSFLLHDSLRNILFKFKDIFAYDSRYIRNIHIHLFAPWAIVNYSSKNKFVTLTTEYMALKDKENNRRGISYTISSNPKSDKLLDYPYAWPSDDSIKGDSYIQTIIKYPLPDTLFLIIWGRSDFYMPYSIYKTLPDSIRINTLSSKSDYNGQIKLAQIKFILTDSVINHKSPKGIKRKLIIPWVTKL